MQQLPLLEKEINRLSGTLAAPPNQCKQELQRAAMQQYMLLQRNLVYTGITRGKKLVVLIGQRKALEMAVRNNRTENRFSGLLGRLVGPG
jgi:hypothetical protein